MDNKTVKCEYCNDTKKIIVQIHKDEYPCLLCIVKDIQDDKNNKSLSKKGLILNK